MQVSTISRHRPFLSLAIAPFSHSPSPSPTPVRPPPRQPSTSRPRTRSGLHCAIGTSGPTTVPLQTRRAFAPPGGLVCVERCDKPPPSFSPRTSCPPGGAQRPSGQTEGQTHWGYAPLRSPVLQYPLCSKELRPGAIRTTGGGVWQTQQSTQQNMASRHRRAGATVRCGWVGHTQAPVSALEECSQATGPGVVLLATRKQAWWCRCTAEPSGPSPLLCLCTLREYGVFARWKSMAPRF